MNGVPAAGLALLVMPAPTELNEESEQEGAEGKENHRFVFSFFPLF